MGGHDRTNGDVLQLVDGNHGGLQEERNALGSLIPLTHMNELRQRVLLVRVIIDSDAQRPIHKRRLLTEPLPSREVGLEILHVLHTTHYTTSRSITRSR